MTYDDSRVILVTDFDQIAQEMVPELVWMVRPILNRKLPQQRITMTAEIVDLATLNLATMSTFEVL